MSTETDTDTISIKVVFYSTLQKTAQTNETTIDIEKGTTLQKTLIQIQNIYFTPNNGRILKADNSNIDVGMICLIDDVDMNLMGGMQFKILKPITIVLISSLHGG